MSPPSVLHLIVFLTLLFSSISGTARETFIVHVSKAHKPSIFATNHRWYHALLSSVAGELRPARILYTYSRIAHGFAVRLSRSQAESIRRLPGVLAVTPDRVHHLHTTRTPRFLSLTDSNGLWPAANYGDDIVIGVLDTGIWPERPSFSDAGLPRPPNRWQGKCDAGPDFCNNKIIGARFYHKGYVASVRMMNGTTDLLSPRDTDGHGTHTASTAAGAAVPGAGFFSYAEGEARGMAPLARIAAYKICWSRGCFDSDILAAMDQAVSDGVDIISLSVGATGSAPDYDYDSIAIGAFGAIRSGVLVSCSAGNSGPEPKTAVNIAPWILTVGASTIDREFPADVILGDGTVLGGVSLYSGNPLGSDRLPLVYQAERYSSSLCLPGSLDPTIVAGKIVLCDRGFNARVEKGSSVKEAGGAGMILANTAESGEELVADAHLLPATMVGHTAAKKIRRYAGSVASPNATIAFRGTVTGRSLSAPQVAAFSSRGPHFISPEIIKPDVVAPGVNILAGWTGFAGPTGLDIDSRRVDFNIISGTSMACPHVSGLAALLRKAHPGWSPAAIKSALMTTAYAVDNSGSPIKDVAFGTESTPFVHGSGHVDPNKALNPGLVYDADVSDYLVYLCAVGYNPERIAVIAQGETVDCSRFGNPGNLNYPSFSVVFGPQLVIQYQRTVTNVGPSNSTYEASVSVPSHVKITVSPSRLSFAATDQKLTYSIKFELWAESPGELPWPSFGYIVWSDGMHSVRSPIAFSFQDIWVASA
ncbi:subtilisin-like protease SBT1.4 [Nymphaea colorata]|nr:subtilisin-like protease SBT1.4 [Nymphaea colorata]